MSSMMMHIDQNPVFRKSIVPWYDSEGACFVFIGFMFIVFLFGVVGILTAREAVEYHSSTWVAVLLAVMSGGVIISTTIRLIKRYARRLSK